MARPTKTQQPELGGPGEQALVTPTMMRPEVLLAMQHQQSNQAIHNECASIRQELGMLRGELQGLKDANNQAASSIRKLERFHSIVLGFALAISVLIGGLWYFVGSKISTLLELADSQQFVERYGEQEVKQAQSQQVGQ